MNLSVLKKVFFLTYSYLFFCVLSSVSQRIPVTYGSAVTLRNNKSLAYLGLVVSSGGEVSPSGVPSVDQGGSWYVQRGAIIDPQAKTVSASTTRWDGAKITPQVTEAKEDVIQARDVVKVGDIIRLESTPVPGQNAATTPSWLGYDVNNNPIVPGGDEKKRSASVVSQPGGDSSGFVFMVVKMGDFDPSDSTVYAGDKIALCSYVVKNGSLSPAYLGATAKNGNSLESDVFTFCDGTFNIPFLFDFVWIVSAVGLTTMTNSGLGKDLNVAPQSNLGSWGGNLLYSAETASRFNSATVIPSLKYGDIVTLNHVRYGFSLWPTHKNGTSFGGQPNVLGGGHWRSYLPDGSPEYYGWMPRAADWQVLGHNGLLPGMAVFHNYNAGQLPVWSIQPGDDPRCFNSPKIGKEVRSGDMIKLQYHGADKNGRFLRYLTIGYEYPGNNYYEVGVLPLNINKVQKAQVRNFPYALAVLGNSGDGNKMGIRIFKKGGKVGDPVMPEDNFYLQSFFYTEKIEPELQKRPAYLGSSNLQITTSSTHYHSWSMQTLVANYALQEVAWRISENPTEVPQSFSENYLWRADIIEDRGYTNYSSIFSDDDIVANATYKYGGFAYYDKDGKIANYDPAMYGVEPVLENGSPVKDANGNIIKYREKIPKQDKYVEFELKPWPYAEGYQY